MIFIILFKLKIKINISKNGSLFLNISLVNKINTFFREFSKHALINKKNN